MTKSSKIPGGIGILLLAGLGAVGALAGRSDRPAANKPGVPETPRTALGKLPLSFEVNEGQADPAVRYLSRGSGCTMLLTGQDAVFRLREPGAKPRKDAAGNPLPALRKPRTAAVRMRFPGANAAPKVAALHRLPGRSNYLVGRDPSKWHTRVSHFARVKYAQLYPGVDLDYYGSNGRVEYDFTVAPGTDPGKIRMQFDGADRLRIDEQGNLQVNTTAGALRHQRPVAYQEVGGLRKTVLARYAMREDRSISFEVTGYDPTRPLVIDPVLTWSTYVGGSGTDEGNGIALDEDRNVYITGSTDSVDFPVVPGSYQEFPTGGFDGYITKLTPDGTGLIYSTYFGGSGDEASLSIGVDPAGRAYVTGATASSEDFPIFSPPQSDPAQAVYGGGPTDAFVTKLNASGEFIVYSTYLGGGNSKEGDGSDVGKDIFVDRSGNAYVAGATSSVGFPLKEEIQAVYGGKPSDAFVTKLNVVGEIDFSTFLGGGAYNYQGGTDYGLGEDVACGITVDPAGDVLVTGATSSKNFPTLNPYQRINRSTQRTGSDAFVVKIASGGQKALYSTYLGGGQNDAGLDIATDLVGNPYITGVTRSNNFPTGKVNQPLFGTRLGGDDIFVTKMDAGGFQLIYSTYFGGADNDEGRSIAVDGEGNAYVTGRTSSVNFPVTRPIQDRFGGLYDGFVFKLNAIGRNILYSAYFGSNDQDVGNGIAVDSNSNAYVVGTTFAPSFPTTVGVFQETFAGGISDAFVAKITDDEGTTGTGGRLRVPKRVRFGKVPMGATVTKTFNIRNGGKQRLTGTIDAASAPYLIVEGGGPFALAKGQTVKVTVRFKPDQLGRIQRVLTIHSTDNRNPTKNVTFDGTGRP